MPLTGTEWARKGLHLTTAVVPLALARGVSQDRLSLLLAILFLVAVAVELGRRKSTAVDALFTRYFGWMLRRHEAEHGLTGAFWLLLALFMACEYLNTTSAIIVTWAASVGDAAAALAGRTWRLWVPGEGKTLVGALACLVATMIGAQWLGGFGAGAAALVGLAAAAAEWPSWPLDDNVRVAAGAAIATLLLQGGVV